MRLSGFFFVIIFYVFSFNQLVKADHIVLASGDTITGEVVIINQTAGMIVEIRSQTQVYNRTIPLGEVNEVIDQSGIIIYKQGRLLKHNIADYFDKLPQHDLDGSQKHTIVFTDGSSITDRITLFNEEVVQYQRKYISIADIQTIDGLSPEVFIEQHNLRPMTRYFSYPQISIEVAYSSIKFKAAPYDINNQSGALQLGLSVEINRYISAGISGVFTFGFGSGESDENDSDGYFLGMLESRFQAPFEYVQPWIGIAIASQSLTYFIDHSFKLKTSSIDLCYSAGVNYPLSPLIRLFISARYIPMSEQQITHSELVPTTFNMSNLILTAGIQFVP